MTPNVLIVEARFYAHIADQMLDGATAALEAGGAHFERITVPGALEIPAAILFAAKAGEGAGKSFDGYVALGCVIRGETSHYELVCDSCARGIQELALGHGLAIGFGVLTVETEAQALARAAVDGKNKGGDAARACLSLINLRARLGAHL